jgi:hypothetical protein
MMSSVIQVLVIRSMMTAGIRAALDYLFPQGKGCSSDQDRVDEPDRGLPEPQCGACMRRCHQETRLGFALSEGTKKLWSKP